MAPITGDAASIGQEQRNWVRYAVRGFNRSQKRMVVRLLEGDTQLDPAQASTVATRYAANSRLFGVVGPAGSQEVLAVNPIFRRANIPFISGSATRTSLTVGADHVPQFFRVVPHDGVQGPTIARYIRQTLKARRVVVVDDQTSYSVPLSNSIQANLRAGGVNVQRESVNQDQSDFSALVSRIPQNTQVVVLAWQLAAKAQVFGVQMREQGRSATIFGTDGLFSPTDFKIEGSYVAAFAPDIRNIASSRQFVRGYTQMFNNKFGTFGPPSFAAARALINAIVNSCKNGKATRAEVLTWVRRTEIKNNILGGTLRFTRRGDPVGAKFYIFRIVRGQYRTVG